MADIVESYFRRIGYAGPAEGGEALLRDLHWRHVATIPFENLDVLLGRPIELDMAAIHSKLVTAGRGGYCFEQNNLYRAVLTGLGFAVEPLAARVWWGRSDETLPPRTHMALRVKDSARTYLADVGFGGMTPTAPLLWEMGQPQATSHETYRLVPLEDARVPGEIALQAEIGDTWETLYSFLPLMVDPADFGLANWYVSTHPESFFTKQMIVARPFAEGRQILQERKATKRARDRSEDVSLLESRQDLVESLRARFGLHLPKADIDRLWARLGVNEGLARCTSEIK